MTPKNLDKAFSINPNSNNFANSTINNPNFKPNLNLHTINENSNNQFQSDSYYRIVLDDVIKKFKIKIFSGFTRKRH
jgi:hypothetical protein